MSTIAGVYARNIPQASESLWRLLNAQLHRGNTSPHFWVDGTVIRCKEAEDAAALKGGTLGIANAQLPAPSPSSFMAEGHGKISALALDGEIYNRQELAAAISLPTSQASNDSEVLLRFMEEQLAHGNTLPQAIQKVYRRANGVFAVALVHNETIYAFRDVLGSKPVWFGYGREAIALTSEPSALAQEGVQCLHPLLPGHVLEISAQGATTYPLADPVEIVQGPSLPPASLPELQAALHRAVDMRCRNTPKAGLYFSGGIDSALMAVLLREKIPGLRLYTVGLAHSRDVQEAGNIADALGIPISITGVSQQELVDYASHALHTLGYYDPLQWRIAVPEYIAAYAARKDKQTVVFSGQGADELFCGYHNFRAVLQEKGYAGVEEEMQQLCRQMWARNMYREDIISMRHSLEARAPYLDTEFMKKAFSIPAQQKIRGPGDTLRKYPLRALAKQAGLPETVYRKPKKAIQYSTGISAALSAVKTST